MRAGALPSPANQALVLSGVVAAAKQEGWKVNLIEAFDQPWKRLLEGTVGGYWGLFGDGAEQPKFRFGAAGVERARMAPRGRARRRARRFSSFFRPGSAPDPRRGQDVARAIWRSQRSRSPRVSCSGSPPSACTWKASSKATGCAPWACSLSPLAVPLAAAFAIAHGDRIASLRPCRSTPAAGGARISVAVVLAALLAAHHGRCHACRARARVRPALQGLPTRLADRPRRRAGNPRLRRARRPSRPGMAEIVGALVLAGSALFIIVNEGIANWQALLFAGLLVVLALTLLRAHAARSSAPAA